jgi:hypothetical protein
VVKIAGLLLILARLIAMPMTSREWGLLGAIGLIGLISLLLRYAGAEERAIARGAVEAEVAPDDASEPAPCPACRGVIPSGLSRCPTCGWTYSAQPSELARDG